MNSKYFSFVRHGQVDGPAALYGSTDICLSSQGYSDLMRCLTEIHNHKTIDQLISSPLKRCALVAQEFSQQYQLPITLNEQLQELHFGDWDGVDFNRLSDAWPQLELFWQAPQLTTPPNGESLDMFKQRVAAAWQAMQKTPHNHTVIVCHGGTIRLIIAEILNIPLTSNLFQQLHIGYCSHTRIELAAHPAAKPILRWIGAQP